MIPHKLLLKSIVLIGLMILGCHGTSVGTQTLYITAESDGVENLKPEEWAQMQRAVQDMGISTDPLKTSEGWEDPSAIPVRLRASEEGYPALASRIGGILSLWVLNPSTSDRELVITFPADRGIVSTRFRLAGSGPNAIRFGKGHPCGTRKRVAQRCHLPAKSLLIFRSVNLLPPARAHLNTLYECSRYASTSAGSRRRWLAACNEVSRNLDAIGRLLGSLRQVQMARHIHRALLASAQIEAMGRNLMNRQSDSALRDEVNTALAGLMESLSAMSGVMLDVRASLSVEHQNPAQKVTVSLMNYGREAVKWLTFRLKTPSGWKISPTASLSHPRIEPGQTISATFTVTPAGDPQPEERLEGDVSYFYINSAVHLKVGRQALPEENN